MNIKNQLAALTAHIDQMSMNTNLKQQLQTYQNAYQAQQQHNAQLNAHQQAISQLSQQISQAQHAFATGGFYTHKSIYQYEQIFVTRFNRYLLVHGTKFPVAKTVFFDSYNNSINEQKRLILFTPEIAQALAEEATKNEYILNFEFLQTPEFESNCEKKGWKRA